MGRGTRYVGVDLHKKFLQACTVDGRGKVLENSRVDNTRSAIRSAFSHLDRKRTRMAVESSSVSHGFFRFVADELGLDIVMSNPYQTSLIARSTKKTDESDAQILAELLCKRYLPVCYVPPKEVVEARQLARYRDRLVRARTSLKNSIHAITLQSGTKIPGKAFSDGYCMRLRAIGDYRIDGMLGLIGSHDGEIAQCEKKMAAKIAASQAASLIKTIPGVGVITAFTVDAEVGDWSRFDTARMLCSYAGLVASTRISADSARYGRITRQGSRMLRHVLTEAALTHARYCKDSDISIFRERLRKRRGSGKSTVAAARKLLCVMHSMVKDGREFVPNYGHAKSRVELIGV